GGPIGDRVDLHETAFLVPGCELDISAILRMLAADPGDPALRALELAVQRANLAHLAAGLAVVDRMAEAEHAIAGDQRLDLGCFRRHHPDAQAVTNFREFDGLQYLREQPSRVEGEDIEVDVGFGDRMEDGLIVETKTRGEGDAALDRPPHFGYALGEVLDSGDPGIQLLRLTLRSV